MKGKREVGLQKGQMARRLVYYCIAVLSLTLLWAVAMKTYGVKEGVSIDLGDVLTFVSVAFGGELLLLCVKRTFAKDKPIESEEAEG